MVDCFRVGLSRSLASGNKVCPCGLAGVGILVWRGPTTDTEFCNVLSLLHLIPEFTRHSCRWSDTLCPRSRVWPSFFKYRFKSQFNDFYSFPSFSFYGFRDYCVIAHEAHLASAFRQYRAHFVNIVGCVQRSQCTLIITRCDLIPAVIQSNAISAEWHPHSISISHIRDSSSRI
jgi:hypothetical protein